MFDKLGIKKSDIIVNINNQELKSYKDAFRVYNKLNKTSLLNIKVLRDNKIVELEYEIQ